MTIAIAGVPVVLRAMEAADLAFVWETSMKVRKPHDVSWREWRDDTAENTHRSIHAPLSAVVVAEADGVIIGFAHSIGGVLRMVYVKRDLRGFGYGMLLIGAPAPMVFVHRPNLCWRKWTQARNIRWREPT